jgi:hypothetical protein
MRAPAAWIFQAVPEQYDLRRALASLDDDLWLASQRAKDMAPDQKVFFWLARKGGGIVATGRIESHAEDEPAPTWQLPYWMPAARVDAAVIKPRVRVRYLKKFPARPLSRDLLKMHAALVAQQPIGPVYVGTNFAVSETALPVLEELVARQ